MVNTIKRIVDLYDLDFGKCDNYKKIPWCDVETWDFEELNCARKEHLDGYFNDKRFFDDKLEFMDNAYQILILFMFLGFKIKIVTLGHEKNLQLKKSWLENNMPEFEFCGLNIDNTFDKSSVDMSDGIFIDDCESNLDSSNSKYKICFGDEYEWNKNTKYVRCNNWYDVYRYITKLEGVIK